MSEVGKRKVATVPGLPPFIGERSVMLVTMLFATLRNCRHRRVTIESYPISISAFMTTSSCSTTFPKRCWSWPLLNRANSQILPTLMKLRPRRSIASFRNSRKRYRRLLRPILKLVRFRPCKRFPTLPKRLLKMRCAVATTTSGQGTSFRCHQSTVGARLSRRSL